MPHLVGPLSDAGRNEEALAAAHIAVERRSDSPDAHANLGQVRCLTARTRRHPA